MAIIKIGSRVITPNGYGTIKTVEDKYDKHLHRWGIELEKSPFSFSPVYYFKDEIQKINKDSFDESE